MSFIGAVSEYANPFGQMLDGYRSGVKDTYDRALKGIQIQSSLAKMRHAEAAAGRAAQTHAQRQRFQKLYGDELDRLAIEEKRKSLRLRGAQLDSAIEEQRDAVANREHQRTLRPQLQERDQRVLQDDVDRLRAGAAARANPPAMPNYGRPSLNLGSGSSSAPSASVPSIPGVVVAPRPMLPPSALTPPASSPASSPRPADPVRKMSFENANPFDADDTAEPTFPGASSYGTEDYDDTNDDLFPRLMDA